MEGEPRKNQMPGMADGHFVFVLGYINSGVWHLLPSKSEAGEQQRQLSTALPGH